jgi:hypothetical protein
VGFFCRNAIGSVAAYEVHCCAYMRQLGLLNDCPIAIPSSCGLYLERVPMMTGSLFDHEQDEGNVLRLTFLACTHCVHFGCSVNEELYR